MKEAVIFDMDGVIVDSGPAHTKSWQMLGRELGKPVSDEAFNAVFGRSSRDIIRVLFGDAYNGEEVARLDARKEALYRDIVRKAVPEMPGAVDSIRALHDSGFRMAIASSGPDANISLVLDALKIRRFFPAVVTGFDVQHGKPHPQCFLLAAERIGVPPARCVVIEDAPAGIEAARRAGMRSVALTSSHPKEALQDADRVVHSMPDLTPDLIHSLLT
jgi:beta-phosphoglucomutase